MKAKRHMKKNKKNIRLNQYRNTGESYEIYARQDIFPPKPTDIIPLIVDVGEIQDNMF